MPDAHIGRPPLIAAAYLMMPRNGFVCPLLYPVLALFDANPLPDRLASRIGVKCARWAAK